MENKKTSNINIHHVGGNVVISQNQKGGSTSHEDSSPNRISKWTKFGVAAGILSALLALLTFLGMSRKEIKKTPQKMEQAQTYNVYTGIKTTQKNTDEKKTIYNAPKIFSSKSRNKKEVSMLDKKEGKNISLENVKGDAVISQNQSGGITAHTYINQVNINQVPEPKFSIKTLVENQPQDGFFKSQFLLTVDTKIAIKNLSLRVEMEGIRKLDVDAQRSGVEIKGLSGVKDGFALDNLQNAYGDYLVTVISEKPGKITMIYDYE